MDLSRINTWPLLPKIPYAAYFSFGEKLPVIEQGVNDPAGLGFAYETISALIANNFESIDDFMENRDSFINMADKSKWGRDAVKIHISYSHKDTIIKNQLESHLGILQRKGLATFWSDEKIVAGMEWRNVIKENLLNSQIYLLLISPSYLSSDFIREEMQLVFDRAINNEILVIPIILEPSAWETIPYLESLKVLPGDGKSLSEQENTEESIDEIVKQIEAAIIYIKNKKTPKGVF